MDWAQFQGLGWATAGAVLAITAALAVLRRWRRSDERKKEREELLEKYRRAVDGRDLDLASALAARLRELGGEPR